MHFANYDVCIVYGFSAPEAREKRRSSFDVNVMSELHLSKLSIAFIQTGMSLMSPSLSQ